MSGPRKMTYIALQSIMFRAHDQASTWENLEARNLTLFSAGLYC